MPLPSALLLLGPTGAGKTPLGDWLQRHGLAGRRCHHFDFGAQLRAVSAGRAPAGFTAVEAAFVRDVLERGALLEDKDFPLANKILRAFMADRRVQPADWLILNGLPRHAGQAAAVESTLAVRAVVELRCDADTVAARLARNTGGDRHGRTDDTATMVRQKLALYEQRTRPLVEHYHRRGSLILGIPVGPKTTAADMARMLEQSTPPIFP